MLSLPKRMLSLYRSYASQLGYFEDPFLKLMSKSKPRKMLPIINRGTWSRVHAYQKMLFAFFALPGAKQIVSFGSGFDTTYFYMKSKFPEVAMKFVEIDFDDIAAKKANIISKNPILATMRKDGGDTYFLIPCDLRDIAKLSEEFKKVKLDPKIPTFIMTECVLVYMEPQQSRDLVKFCGKFFKTAAILNYEMINPHDALGKVMIENVESRGCKLLGLREIDSLEKENQRFIEAGFTKVQGVTMLDFYNNYSDKEEKQRIEKIEIFDEFEEWNMLQSHYCLVLGVKGQLELSL
eukprot:TRINITY_DN39_c0_g4_i1.p1 TRINITY_DN39_c0_g4~~TRINITY_DN39_c0_g4_i1.p1  ORF type:complete len:293 (+),score=80.22 TRINITY_DN39_c0_g4_i1:128-1006(+)